MSFHDDLIAAGLPVLGTAVQGTTVLFTRPLTPQEAQTYERIVNPAEYRRMAAHTDASNIPSWATWTQDDLAAYVAANLSTANVAAISNLADAKTMIAKQNTVIGALAKMVLALRDYTRIIE